MIPENDYLIYYVRIVRDMIWGAKYFDDGDYGEDEYNKWIEMMPDLEEDEGTNLDVEENESNDDKDRDWSEEDEDVMSFCMANCTRVHGGERWMMVVGYGQGA